MNYIEFINEYNKLLNKNEYISLKTFNKFLNSYYPIIKEEIKTNLELQKIINNIYEELEKHNKEYINKALITEKEYFDNMFKNTSEDIILDEEQRRAILCDEDYSLIIAGAGSGKTTTMSAKVKYLLERKKVDPSKIVVISYTNKATNELEDRIKYEFDLPVDIMTFHSLGIKIIRKIIKDKPIKPVSEKEQEKIILDYFKEVLFKDKKLLTTFITTFNKYKINDGYNMFSKGFVENYQKYETFDDYFNNYKIRKLQQNKNNLEEIIHTYEEKFLKFPEPTTLKGEKTKSIGEAEIANFLFKHGIEYKYEEPYPERVDIEKTYLPDFTIEINGIPVYIEYYGLSSYDKNSTISEREQKKYNDIRNKKRNFHKFNNNNYIELDYHNANNLNYIEKLKKELEIRGANIKKKTNEEIYNSILETNEKAEIFVFVKFIIKLINSIKSSLDRNKINEKIINYINSVCLTKEEKIELIRESELIIKVYNYYQSKLIPLNQIDFSDMIYYANKYVASLPSNENILNYEYIIIDEYQDISISRYNLAKNLSLLTKSKVISVGDDWQTIFSFAGSRIDLFYNYQKLFPGAKSLLINNTYRNSQQLINLAGYFITKNPYQIKKNLKSNKTRHAPIKIVPYSDNEFEVLSKLIDKIHKENPFDKIMILSRKNKTLKQLSEHPLFEQGLAERIIYKNIPSAYIEAMTIHKSKGLGSDQVIILNVTNKDFPLEEHGEYWLNNLFNENKYEEDYPDAEERRIFYVALTRTKKDVYLLTPKEKSKKSPFINELLEKDNI